MGLDTFGPDPSVFPPPGLYPDTPLLDSVNGNQC